MATGKGNKMLQLINYRMKITVQDNRVLIGKLMAFDKHMNLILGDCEEFRKIGKGKKEEREDKRPLGLVLLRGECIISMTVEAPPTAEENRLKTASTAAATSGPGKAVATGRGITAPPVTSGNQSINPSMAPAGLTGPVRGIGGPSSASMNPTPIPGSMPPPGMPMRGPPMGMPPPGMMPPGGMQMRGPPMGMPPPGMMPPGGMQMRGPPMGMPPPGMMPPGGPPMGMPPPGMMPPGGMPPPGMMPPGGMQMRGPPMGMPPPGMMPPGGMPPPGMPMRGPQRQ